MSDMKCPVCNKGTVKEFETAPYFACSNEFCPSYSETDTTEYDILIRTRKALDVAVDKLKGIKAYYDDSYAGPHFVNWHIVAQRLANDADDATKAITAEQKDVK